MKRLTTASKSSNCTHAVSVNESETAQVSVEELQRRVGENTSSSRFLRMVFHGKEIDRNRLGRRVLGLVGCSQSRVIPSASLARAKPVPVTASKNCRDDD